VSRLLGVCTLPWLHPRPTGGASSRRDTCLIGEGRSVRLGRSSGGVTPHRSVLHLLSINSVGLGSCGQSRTCCTVNKFSPVCGTARPRIRLLVWGRMLDLYMSIVFWSEVSSATFVTWRWPQAESEARKAREAPLLASDVSTWFASSCWCSVRVAWNSATFESFVPWAKSPDLRQADYAELESFAFCFTIENT
jgi:hypothetical protein